jgi:hypothetical protein
MKHKQNDSSIWADLLKITNVYLKGRKNNVKNGQKTLFWKDTWLYDQPLNLLCPDLFNMCEQQNILVSQFMVNPQLITFSRWLVGIWRLNWESILHDVSKIQLCEGEDIILWKFGSKGLFPVKFVYNALTMHESRVYYKKVWKGKIPVKIKAFSGCS